LNPSRPKVGLETRTPEPETRTLRTASGIPRSLAPYFQEYDLDALDPAQHGDRREVRRLFEQYGRGPVREWVQGSGARRLPWRRYNLWCVLMDLPPARRSERRGVWPY
jgi:hypothetical protein